MKGGGNVGIVTGQQQNEQPADSDSDARAHRPPRKKKKKKLGSPGEVVSPSAEGATSDAEVSATTDDRAHRPPRKKKKKKLVGDGQNPSSSQPANTASPNTSVTTSPTPSSARGELRKKRAVSKPRTLKKKIDAPSLATARATTSNNSIDRKLQRKNRRNERQQQQQGRQPVRRVADDSSSDDDDETAATTPGAVHVGPTATTSIVYDTTTTSRPNSGREIGGTAQTTDLSLPIAAEIIPENDSIDGAEGRKPASATSVVVAKVAGYNLTRRRMIIVILLVLVVIIIAVLVTLFSVGDGGDNNTNGGGGANPTVSNPSSPRTTPSPTPMPSMMPTHNESAAVYAITDFIPYLLERTAPPFFDFEELQTREELVAIGTYVVERVLLGGSSLSLCNLGLSLWRSKIIDVLTLSFVFIIVAYGNIGLTIPTEIGLMTSLTKLDVSDNGILLWGTIPSEIGLLTSLVELNVGK